MSPNKNIYYIKKEEEGEEERRVVQDYTQKRKTRGLVCVAQLLGTSSQVQFPVRAQPRLWVLSPQSGHVWRQPIDVSLTSMFLSSHPFLSLETQ